MQIDLSAQLAGQVFPFMMVFTRLSAGLMMFPGIGETFVPMRVRMLFALVLSFLLYPLFIPTMPPIPPLPGEVVLLMLGEATVGIFFGVIMRLIIGIIETAGSIIGMDIGLSNAMILNPALAGQSALTSAFLSVAAIALIFITGLHELLFRALLDTYKLFPVGKPLPIGDMTEVVVKIMSETFAIGVQLAAPFMVIGLLIYTALGVMQRLMPQIQLFLVMLPVQIWGGLFAFNVCIAAILGVWITVYDDMVGRIFIRPGP